MAHHGAVPEEMIAIVSNIYEESVFHVQTEGGVTNNILQRWGVKQGCTVTPFLFNLASEGLLWGVETAGASGYSFSQGAAVQDPGMCR